MTTQSSWGDGRDVLWAGGHTPRSRGGPHDAEVASPSFVTPLPRFPPLPGQTRGNLPPAANPWGPPATLQSSETFYLTGKESYAVRCRAASRFQTYFQTYF